MKVHISGNETSDEIVFPKPGLNEIRLRADSLDANFSGVIQRADIGTSGWMDVYVNYTETARFDYNTREYVATGNAKYRVVTTGYGTSSGVYFSGYELVVQSELTNDFLQDRTANNGEIQISDETGGNYTFWNYRWLR